jgi:type IV pilus biogenesis protein CpaD/CtpE
MIELRRLSLVIIVLGGAGCGGRMHLTESYGRSYREAFAHQVAHPQAQARAPEGLDAQESSIVVATYRAQLAPKEARTEQQEQMLFVAPAQASGAYVPPPSVPQGR